MLNWFFRKKLTDVLNETKKVKIQGVVFTIRKINLLDYLNGSKVLIQSYDTHKTAAGKLAAQITPATDDKVKRHYSDVLVAGVVDPKLVFKKENEDETAVGDLLPNWELVDTLYSEIMIFTYGKKKLKQAMSAAKSLSS